MTFEGSFYSCLSPNSVPNSTQATSRPTPSALINFVADAVQEKPRHNKKTLKDMPKLVEQTPGAEDTTSKWIIRRMILPAARVTECRRETKGAVRDSMNIHSPIFHT